MRKELGMAVTLVAMCGVIAWSNPASYGETNLLNTSRQIAMLGIFAIGVGFVIVTGGIDLSIGSIIGLSGVLIARVSAPSADGTLPTPESSLRLAQFVLLDLLLLGSMAYAILFSKLNRQSALRAGCGIGFVRAIVLWQVSNLLAGSGPATGAGHPNWIGITLALDIALTIGLLQGLLITRMALQPFIVTLAGMLFIRGVAQTITAGGNISFGNSGFRDLADRGQRLTEWLTIPYPVFFFAAIGIVATYLLHFTVFGRHVYALGGNREAARYSGVPVERVETLTYMISAGSAGLAGIPFAAYIGQMSHTVGMAYELEAIAAAVLGGCSLRGGEGTILGIFIGSAILRVMDNGINMFKIDYVDSLGNQTVWRLDENWRMLIIGGVILGAVLLDQATYFWRDRSRRRRAVRAAE